MKKIERNALVPYSAEQMFNLVNDVEKYPEFMSGCVSSDIVQRGDGWLEARLDLAKLGIHQSFVTRNILTPPSCISMTLVSGPFKKLSGAWEFKTLNETACKVSFWLEFEFSNPVFAMAAGKFFEQIASEQVNSVCDRAKRIY